MFDFPQDWLAPTKSPVQRKLMFGLFVLMWHASESIFMKRFAGFAGAPSVRTYGLQPSPRYFPFQVRVTGFIAALLVQKARLRHQRRQPHPSQHMRGRCWSGSSRLRPLVLLD